MNADQTEPTGSPTLKYIRHLAETVGPRGSATPQEAQAADYVQQVMEEAGLQPTKETFTSARSSWRVYALASGLGLLAEALFLTVGWTGAIPAATLMTLALSSMLLEMTFEHNPLRWVLPKGQSQNVWARIPATDHLKRRVLLVAHLDSQRAAKMFSSTGWLSLFKALLSASLAAMIFNIIIFVIGYLIGKLDMRPWYSLSVPPAILIWWVAVLTLEADLRPYTAGANDNASGVGVMLGLATRLKQQPLQTTEVWALGSGCKEVGCHGMADWLKRHRGELTARGSGKAGSAYCITLDSVGGAGAGPCYLSRQTFLTTAHGDSSLLRLADKIATRSPELGAYNMSMFGMYTEGLVAARAGLRTLTFVNLRKDGTLPHWHQATDVFANLDGQVVQNTESFVWELLQALDAVDGR